MAITPRSKGLGNIGAIVDRQGRASVAAPVKPTSVSKPKIAAPVKPGPRPVVRKPATAPAPKPVAKVAPKPAPKMAPTPKPSPFKPAAKTTPAPKTGGPIDYEAELNKDAFFGISTGQPGNFTPSKRSEEAGNAYFESIINAAGGYDQYKAKNPGKDVFTINADFNKMTPEQKYGYLPENYRNPQQPTPGGGKPDTRAPGGGGMDFNGNPIGGGMGGQFNIAAPGQGNLARNTGPGNGGPQLVGGPPRNDLILPPFKMPTPGNGGAPKPQPGREGELAEMPDDLYNSMMAYNKSRDDQMQAAKAAGDPYWFAIPESADIKPWTQWQMDYYERKNPSLPPPTNTGTGPGTPYDPYMPPPPMDLFNGGSASFMPNIPPGGFDPGFNAPVPGYGGPFTPRPDMGPGVGFGVGLPQPGYDGMFGGNTPYTVMPPGSPDYAYNGDTGQAELQPAPYNAGMQSPRRVINQVGKPGFQPRPNMSNAFNPTATSDYDQLEGPGYNTGGFMGGGSGSLFGGGGFAGK